MNARISLSTSLSSKREGSGRAELKDEKSLHDVDVSGAKLYSGSFSSVVAATYRRNSQIEGPKKLCRFERAFHFVFALTVVRLYSSSRWHAACGRVLCHC